MQNGWLVAGAGVFVLAARIGRAAIHNRNRWITSRLKHKRGVR
jgi:hypothetical protein